MADMMTGDVRMGDAATIHAALLTLDTHIDIPWPEGPSFAEEGPRRVDLPKMQRGALDGGFFAAYVPQGPRTPAAEADAHARALAMLDAIAAMGSLPGARRATSAAAIEAAGAAGLVAIVPCVENGHTVGADLSRLAALRARGATYLTITHNGHNTLADSAVPRPDLNDAPELHGGLSALGRAAVPEMNRLGMLIDVSHVSRAAMLQLADLSRAPIVATHSCMRALCDHPRNLDDAQLDVLRDVGGVAQVTAVSGFLRLRAKENEVTVGDFCDHLDHAVRRIGVEHVGIGSDFDGGGAVVGWRDAAHGANLTAELIRRGYDRDALALLWGGNFLRVMRRAEAVAGA